VRERGAGALAAAEPVAAKPGAVGAKSRVVVARDELLRGTDSKVDSGRMLALLDRAMQALAGHDHPAEIWRTLVRPSETVSLKVNTLGGRGISTNVLLVAAICKRLQEAASGRATLWFGTATATNWSAPVFILRWAESACNVTGPTAWL